MTVLITGAAGFIGSHLAKRLIALDHKCILIDRVSDYYSQDLKRSRFAELVGNQNKILFEIDLANRESLEKIDPLKISVVIHLAAQPGVRIKFPNNSTYLRDNISGHANILDWTLRNNIPKFIYASSSSVYDLSRNSIFAESEELCSPRNIYARSKFQNEKISELYSEISNTEILGLRFFSVYGPWGRPDMAYFRIIAAALTGNTFTLNGDGNIRRDFTYIGDVIESLAKICLLKKFQYSTLNIGGGNDRTLLEVISIIENLSGVKLKISKAGHDSMDLLRTKADTNRLESCIGTIPQTSIEIGLKTTLDWAMRKDIFPKLDLWKI